MDSQEIIYALQQIANSTKVRGDWEQYDVEDWRDIPTSEEELEKLSADEREFWLSVANS